MASSTIKAWIKDLEFVPTHLGTWTKGDEGHIVGQAPRRKGEDTPTYLKRIQHNEDEKMRWMLMGKTDSEQRAWYNKATPKQIAAKKEQIKRQLWQKRWWTYHLDDGDMDEQNIQILMLKLRIEKIESVLESL